MLKQLQITKPVTIPANIEARLGPSTLLTGESEAAYSDMLSDFAGSVKPEDFVEWNWVKEMTDLTWEIMRIRRFKVGIIDVARKDALESIMRSLNETGEPFVIDTGTSKQLATRWFTDPRAKQKIASQLEQYGLSAESIPAQAFMLRCKELEAAERMLASAEKRRNNTLREISGRRASLARQLREKSDQLVSDKSDVSRIPVRPVLTNVAA